MENIIEETIPGGAHYSLILKRGYTMRLQDIEGGGNVAALFFNSEERNERYNMADTLKAQHIARLAKDCVLYSDMGRILVSISEDTVGWHDTICGTTNAAMIKAQYGERDYQQYHNDSYKNGRDSLLVQLGRWGLGRKDLIANVNFFSKVVVSETGAMSYESQDTVGAYVDLRAEMNTLVVLSATPHPLNPVAEYPAKPIQLTVRHTGVAGPDDPCRLSRPENGRGYANTEAYFAQIPYSGVNG